MARSRLALLDVLLAVLGRVARGAVAAVVIDQVVAGGVAEAGGGGQTLVDVALAIIPSEARVGAVASVEVDPVNALAMVLARVARTVVYICLAILTRVAGGTVTSVGVDAINARCSIFTGTRCTLVYVCLAVYT